MDGISKDLFWTQADEAQASASNAALLPSTALKLRIFMLPICNPPADLAEVDGRFHEFPTDKP
jgi:hypothetical protein